jgi:hypothetical protein
LYYLDARKLLKSMAVEINHWVEFCMKYSGSKFNTQNNTHVFFHRAFGVAIKYIAVVVRSTVEVVQALARRTNSQCFETVLQLALFSL